MTKADQVTLALRDKLRPFLANLAGAPVTRIEGNLSEGYALHFTVDGVKLVVTLRRPASA